MNQKSYRLGTIETSEKLIFDLYIDLRRKVNEWSAITHQTAQARMGYVGQHLVSVVTGYPGGRSGARGKDLILPNNEYGEIKTCYRVDQLGKCNGCGSAVSGIEISCPECGSTNLKKNDDSKWLIGIRHDDEFESILNPKYYYLVLFEFRDLSLPDTIMASIWRVDPTVPGFSYCMIDYYKNIRSASTSKAPFNLWPYQLKFDLMKPILIYRSYITKDDKVNTEIFPGRDPEIKNILKPLQDYSQSQNLKLDKIIDFSNRINIDFELKGNKKSILIQIQSFIKNKKIDEYFVIDELAKSLYLPEIEDYINLLPSNLRVRSGFE